MNEAVFESFSQSLGRLSQILDEPKTIANRDSAIKRFELTFELAWKSLKTYLLRQGVNCRSPKDCLMQAFKLKLIADDPVWLTMIDDRNLSVHTYNEELAEKIYNRLKEYEAFFRKLNSALAARN
jgi:nucleotidyltransferase substrate binding protein (TIGR01987 family)